MALSLFGIILGLVLLMFLAYKGCSIIWVAPVCAVVVAVLGGYSILDAYIGDYMAGMANYVLQWFPAFFLGAVYGKLMDMTGSARSLADAIVRLIGPKFAVAAVVIPCLLMTYGGISLFVVVFVIYPMGYAIYRAADLPRTLLPGAIATGAFGITMTAVPGTPQIQNMIPTTYYGTTPMAAPLMSIVACIVMFVPAYIYLEWRVRQCRKKGLHFTPDPKHVEVDHSAKNLPSWHWLAGIVPLIVVVLMLNLFPKLLLNATGINLASNYSIVIALVCGIAGLLAGIKYVSEIGTDAILAHERALLARMIRGLSDVRGVELFYGNKELQSGVLSVRMAGTDCETLARLLSEHGVCTRSGLHCAPFAHRTAGTLDTGTLRFSFSPFVTPEEIDRVCELMYEISIKLS